jgi:hypothetical protein
MGLVLLLGGALGGCGNYSNEDLAFMNAVPSTSQLAVVLPAAPASVNEAELAQTTHNTIALVNGLLDDVLGLIDGVRTNEPTSRQGDQSRTWGPFPDGTHPGWQWQLIVQRDAADASTFDYFLEAAAPGAPGSWIQFVVGTFDATGGASQGNGQVTAHFDALGKAGFPLDANAMPLLTLQIAYQNYRTQGQPIAVSMAIDRTPDPNGVTSATIAYQVLADGSGQMKFTLVGNIVLGPATETVEVDSGWLPSGAGMATLSVVAGDAAGSTQTECWDATFAAIYNNKPWLPGQDVGTSALCPTLPSFPASTPDASISSPDASSPDASSPDASTGSP